MLAGHWQDVTPVAGDSMTGYRCGQTCFQPPGFPLLFLSALLLPLLICRRNSLPRGHADLSVPSGELSGPAQAAAPGCPVPAPPQAPPPPASQLTGRTCVQPVVSRFLLSSALLLMLRLSEVSVSLELHAIWTVLVTPHLGREWKAAGPDGPAELP